MQLKLKDIPWHCTHVYNIMYFTRKGTNESKVKINNSCGEQKKYSLAFARAPVLVNANIKHKHTIIIIQHRFTSTLKGSQRKRYVISYGIPSSRQQKDRSISEWFVPDAVTFVMSNSMHRSAIHLCMHVYFFDYTSHTNCLRLYMHVPVVFVDFFTLTDISMENAAVL
jgi:hypothetical protein